MSDAPTTSIATGQVWRHHTLGDYCVIRYGGDGKVLIARVGDTPFPHRVWPDYLRRNFRLVERDTAWT